MLVSVIMPTYNCGKFILQSLDSVISQTVTDWEVQIVDDCSTDNTAEVLKPYLEKHPNIHYYVLPQNGGPAVARTEAMKRATGKYIAFLDSDDLWKPDKLEKQIAFMEKTGAKFSATGYGWMDEEGNDLHTVFIPPKKTDYKKMIRLSNPIGNLSVMYDQEALGKFEVPPIKKRNDFALWLKILKKTDYCYGMEEVLGTYRMGRAGSVSSNKLKQATVTREPNYTFAHDEKLLEKVKRVTSSRVIDFVNCKFLLPRGKGIVMTKASYDALWDRILKRENQDSSTFLGCFCDWDNSPRKSY